MLAATTPSSSAATLSLTRGARVRFASSALLGSSPEVREPAGDRVLGAVEVPADGRHSGR